MLPYCGGYLAAGIDDSKSKLDLTKLTDEELEELIRLYKKADPARGKSEGDVT